MIREGGKAAFCDMIGDWMGSEYGANGRRWDSHIFLDHDGRYERHGALRRITSVGITGGGSTMKQTTCFSYGQTRLTNY